MNISFNPQIYTNSVRSNLFKSTNNRLERSPSTDVISFSGSKHNKKPLSDDITTSVKLGEDLIKLSQENNLTINSITPVINQYSDDIEVLPISELAKINPNAHNYQAFQTSHLSEDFKFDDKKIYINTDLAKKDEMNMLGVAMNTAHEFTHIKQTEDPKCAEFIKLLSKGNYDEAVVIMGVGDAVFSIFDNQIQAYTVLPTFQNAEDMINFQQNGMITPHEKNVNKNKMLNDAGYKDEKEFKQKMNEYYKVAFENVLTAAASDPSMAPYLEKVNVNKLYTKIKAYCALKANGEKEAYTTESELAKKYFDTENGLNIDVFPIYYGMLEKSFSQ